MSAKRRKQLHYSPLLTNAACNRAAAERCWKAGLNAGQIAAEFPEVFTVDANGKLGQVYDSEIADGSGRLETKYRITDTAVANAIHKHERRG